MSEAPDFNPATIIGQVNGFSFPGFEGIPFRSQSAAPPNLKSDDPKQPIVVVDARVRILDLSKKEDLLAYEYIWDQAAKHRFTEPTEDRQYDPEAKTWRVFIRFGVRWLEMPK